MPLHFAAEGRHDARVSRLSVSGYRRLKSVDIPLRPLNVMVGANSVGKSSFLDVFDLLAASAEGTLQSSIGDWGDMKSLLAADEQSNGLQFALQMEQQSRTTLDYELWLSSAAAGYVIEHELLAPLGAMSAPCHTSTLMQLGQKRCTMMEAST